MTDGMYKIIFLDDGRIRLKDKTYISEQSNKSDLDTIRGYFRQIGYLAVQNSKNSDEIITLIESEVFEFLNARK